MHIQRVWRGDTMPDKPQFLSEGLADGKLVGHGGAEPGNLAAEEIIQGSAEKIRKVFIPAGQSLRVRGKGNAEESVGQE